VEQTKKGNPRGSNVQLKCTLGVEKKPLNIGRDAPQRKRANHGKGSLEEGISSHGLSGDAHSLKGIKPCIKTLRTLKVRTGRSRMGGKGGLVRCSQGLNPLADDSCFLPDGTGRATLGESSKNWPECPKEEAGEEGGDLEGKGKGRPQKNDGARRRYLCFRVKTTTK